MPNAPAARITDQVQHSEAAAYRTGFGILGGVVGAVIGAALAAPATAVSLALIWGADALTGGLATPIAVALTAVVVVGAGAAVVSSSAGAASAFSDVGADIGKTQKELDGPIVTGVPTIHIGPDRHVAAFLGSQIACKRHNKQQVAQGSATVRLGPGRRPAARLNDKGSCSCWIGQACSAVIIGGDTVSAQMFDGDDPNKGFWDGTLGEVAGVAGWLAPLVYAPDIPALIGAYAATALLGKVLAPALLKRIPEGPWRDVAKAGLSVFPWYKIKFFPRAGDTAEPGVQGVFNRTITGKGKSISDLGVKDPVAGNLRGIPPFSRLPPWLGGPKPSAESPTIQPGDVPGGTSGGGGTPPETPGGGGTPPESSGPGGPTGEGGGPTGEGGGPTGGAPEEPTGNPPAPPGGNPPPEDGPAPTEPAPDEESSGTSEDEEPPASAEDSPASPTKPVGQERGGAPSVPDEESGGGGTDEDSPTVKPGEVPGGAPENTEGDADFGDAHAAPAPATTSTGHPVPPGVDPSHYENLGSDPAVGRFRPNEADTALRVEDQEGVSLERYNPAGPGDKGDWVDPATGTVYDGCSPPPSQYFDQQMSNGNYQQSLQDHAANPNVDRVVVDTTNLNLTPAQEGQLNSTIGGLPPDQQAKIVRVP